MSIAPDDALVSAEQLALVLSWSYKSVKRLCADQRWYADELPAPLDDVTPRRWRLSNVEAWLIANERRSWS